jgi:hypothetical protein
MSFFDKRKKRKLYEQWVEKSGLPPESIPRELEPQVAADEDLEAEEDLYQPVPRGRSTWVIHLTMRHLQILLLIIGVLLVLSSVLITVLITRSC